MKKQREKKKEEKAMRKQEKRGYSTGGGLEHMMAYVNEFGELTSIMPQSLLKNSEAA